ncbi:hypothetical protein KIW84_020949 [Lathyrus oleraceus]|uniref:Uncharacterized protein n=1 Tax=Pisum sativum TaxID=3888 RepID=A0A9D4YC63_PEA|nr:hypothetical protein KIW84_020949 [Pisum sativum]
MEEADVGGLWLKWDFGRVTVYFFPPFQYDLWTSLSSASSELRLAADTLINAPCKVGKEEDSLSLREDTKTEKKKMCQALLHIIFVFDGLCKTGNIDKPH